MEKVWIAVVTTDSGDDYLFASKEKPNQSFLAARVAEIEGEIEEADWYEGTCSYHIEEVEVE